MGKIREVLVNNKLWVAFGALCLVALVLGGVNIALYSQGDNEYAEQSDEEPAEPEEVTDYSIFVDRLDYVKAEAQKILEKDPVDVDALNELYRAPINDYLALGDETNINRARAFIDSRTSDLLSKGLKREALDALVEIDFSTFLEDEQYRQYSTIIQLASELGDTAIVEKYEALANGVKGTFMASCRGSSEVAEALGVENEASELCEEGGEY